MRKFLTKIYVLQKRKDKKKRINPYNPISYLVIVLATIIGILMFGFVGVFDQVDEKNPFKWQ